MKTEHKNVVRCRDCGMHYAGGRWTKMMLIRSEESVTHSDGFCLSCLKKRLMILTHDPKQPSLHPAY